MSREPKLISRRQQDGSYRIWASDGAEHHLLGAVRCEWRQGRRGGQCRSWLLEPAAGLAVKMEPPPATLGAARSRLLESWGEGRKHQSRRHGLPGVFVVVEGGDGAGKSTLVANLVRELARQGVSVSATEEPSRGPVGRILRETLTGRGIGGHATQVTAQEWALLYAADRAHHLREGVLPALARGEVVVCSRYVLSSLAYQGPALGLEWVSSLNVHAPAPDVLLFLEAPPEAGLSRLGTERAPDAFENEARAREAAAGYSQGLAHLERQGVRVVRLDATQPAEAVAREAIAVVQSLLTVTSFEGVGT